MKKASIIEGIASLFVLLFVYTSLSKLVDYNAFVMDMRNQPFPRWMSTILIWTLPMIELAISTLLILNRTRQLGLYLSLILMSLFTVYTATILLHFFKRIPCSCGGVIKKLTWSQHLVFNLFFVILAIVALSIYRKNEDPSMEEMALS